MNSDSADQQESATLELVLFKAGQHRFGVEASRIRSSGILPDYAIPSIEPLLSLPGGESGRHRLCLTVKGRNQDFELSVEAPLELCALPLETIHPLPAAVTAVCTLPGLRALALIETSLILLVDLNALLAIVEDCP